MEIEFNTNRISSLPPTQPVTRTRETIPAGDKAQFTNTEALSQAMSKLPDTRPEVVEKARQVVGSVKYPPDQTLSRIANLLALHMAGRAE